MWFLVLTKSFAMILTAPWGGVGKVRGGKEKNKEKVTETNHLILFGHFFDLNDKLFFLSF